MSIKVGDDVMMPYHNKKSIVSNGMPEVRGFFKVRVVELKNRHAIVQEVYCTYKSPPEEVLADGDFGWWLTRKSVKPWIWKTRRYTVRISALKRIEHESAA